MKLLLVVALFVSAAVAEPLFLHKKAALFGHHLGAAPLPVPVPEPSARIIEKTVEVIKPVEVIKEVPVIRQVEVIKHVPVVRTVIQKVAVPYPVHIERRVPYPVHVERHIPVPVTVERLHTPIGQYSAPYPAPEEESEEEEEAPVVPLPAPHPLAAKLGHLFKGHSIHKRSPIFKKLKAKLVHKVHHKKNVVKGAFQKVFG